ncbi:hypothetical protein J4440_00385 [Candidatus Woesearchaeota archaeon]|nr:hypothetical protein [Candidatus Woesearchaeota archaeon]
MEKLYWLYNIQKEILPKITQELPWNGIAYKSPYSNYPFLSITNIEGALCEFRKYYNLSNRKGKRRYYKCGFTKL